MHHAEPYAGTGNRPAQDSDGTVERGCRSRQRRRLLPQRRHEGRGFLRRTELTLRGERCLTSFVGTDRRNLVAPFSVSANKAAPCAFVRRVDCQQMFRGGRSCIRSGDFREDGLANDTHALPQLLALFAEPSIKGRIQPDQVTEHLPLALPKRERVGMRGARLLR